MENLRELFRSKKFKVALGSVFVAIIGGLVQAQSWPMVYMEISAIAVAYIGAQGLADIGKGKAEVEKKK